MLNNDDEYRVISNAVVIATGVFDQVDILCLTHKILDTQNNIIYMLVKKHRITEPEVIQLVLTFIDLNFCCHNLV